MLRIGAASFVMGLVLVSGATAGADEAYEHAPIQYLSSTATDPVARLQGRLEHGDRTLARDPKNGYLSSVLRELNVPASSQSLVFSKTSFQRDRISPSNPRALYFDDDTYVGYVPGGDVIELASTDPQLGTVFYTLDQPKGASEEKAPADKASPQEASSAAPRFIRQTHTCLQCHGSTMTRDVPGLLIRSIYPDADGQP